MTDNEIIKALKCLCGEDIPCNNCAYKSRIFKCRKSVAIDALDLINRQQAKIEALQMDNEQLQSDIINASMNLEHQQAEIEQLKTDKTLLRQDINADTAEIRALRRKLEISNSEAVREFADRVKMAFYYEFDELIPSIMADKIDNLVKEMVGETE